MNEFSFTVHGQPLSWNHSYAIERRGYRNAMVKTDELVAYQDLVERTCAKAKPNGWKPREEYLPKLGVGLIVIEFRYFLFRDLDCDNTMKPLADAVALGLGWVAAPNRRGRVQRRPVYDDKRFLPRAMSKQTGFRDPRVEVTVIG